MLSYESESNTLSIEASPPNAPDDTIEIQLDIMKLANGLSYVEFTLFAYDLATCLSVTHVAAQDALTTAQAALDELERDGLVYQTGEVRDGQPIFVAAPED